MGNPLYSFQLISLLNVCIGQGTRSLHTPLMTDKAFTTE